MVHGQQTFLVDGYDEQTKTIYKFQGCFYNGCLDCFPNHTMRHPIHLNKTMRDVRKQTKIRIQQLSQLGYRVKEMWECEWNRMIQADPQLKEFIHTDDIVTPLNPREDFFGRRTNAIKLYHKVENDEQIHYSDMISLYPCANLECDYPIGHPEFIDQPGTTDISRYNGLVKCKILPPYELYHPVLPYRYDSKLLFPLCKTCTQQEIKQQPTNNKRSEKCPHSTEERTLTGTWTTLELQKAIEKGYIITYIYEIWHFKERSNQLFQTYIKTFLKIKQEASGWPSECDTDGKKRNYLEEYKKT